MPIVRDIVETVRGKKSNDVVALKVTRRANIDYGKQENFNVVVGGKVVGSGSVHIFDDSSNDMCYLERLDIDKKYRNKGYGTDVLYKVLDRYGSFYTAPDNRDSKRFIDKVAHELLPHLYQDWGYQIDQGFGVYMM